MGQLEHIQIDFVNHTVSFGPPRKLTMPQPTGVHPQINRITRVFRVEVDEPVTVPPRHEARIVRNLVAADHKELQSLQGKTLILEPRGQLGDSIACARSLVCAADGRIPIRICNPFDADVKLHPGMFVGQAEVVPDETMVQAVLNDDVELMTGGKQPGQTLEEVVEKLTQEAEISSSEKVVLKTFLHKHKKAFCIQGELGRYTKHPFSIDTGRAQPIRQMPRPVPYHRKAEVDRQLDEMLQKGVIEPSDSDWASPILLVKKADGTLRFCVDYRKLNAVTKHDSYPLPNINDCLASLGRDSVYFSTLDMASGYWQVEMDPNSQEKAAFTTHRGLFKPVVQPFGPKGGVAHFSRIMTALLGSLQWRMLLIYLDDLLVFSSTFEEHLQRLGLVLEILEEANLKLKPSKCKLFQRSVSFLGHTISAEGIAPKADKISAVRNWPVPKSAQELQQFLGFASFYRRYIPDFATTAEPLNQLTRKRVEFRWEARCEKAFNILKEALCKHPVLAHPDFRLPFQLTTDASATGLGAVLSQIQNGEERPVSYASKTLTASERNYSTTERECLAVVWATEYFDYFLSGAPFTVITDHDPLTYLRAIPQPHGRLARWILRLEQYEYTMKYKPGKSIPHADALSRQPLVATLQLPYEFNAQEFAEAQHKDPVLKKVYSYWRLRQRPPPQSSRQVKEFFRRRGSEIREENGVLLVRSMVQRNEIKQLLAPTSLVTRILQKGHDEAGCHVGAEKTLETIRSRFFWATLFSDVKAWCKSCRTCQHRKHPVTKARAPLQYPPVASRPGQMLAMDFVGPLPETPSGKKHILVVTDMFSKHAEAIPLPDQLAETTATALVKEYFWRQGLPSMLHSDQGRNFESKVIQHLCRILNIRKTRTTSYHPSGNGSCERYNKTLIEMISMRMEEEDQTDWDSWLTLALFAYHSTPHSSTGFTPFELHMGRQPRSSLDTLAESIIETHHPTAKEYLKELQQRMSNMHKLAQRNLIQSMQQRKQYYDKKQHYTPYNKGDLVLLRQMACKPGLKPKLMKERWTGPWTVDKVKGPVNYRIVRKKSQKSKQERLMVHYDRLKPYYHRPEHLTTTDETPDLDGEAGVELPHPERDQTEGDDTDDDNQTEDEDEPEDEPEVGRDHDNSQGEESEDEEGGNQPDDGHQPPVVTRSGRIIKLNRNRDFVYD